MYSLTQWHFTEIKSKSTHNGIYFALNPSIYITTVNNVDMWLRDLNNDNLKLQSSDTVGFREGFEKTT